MKTIRFFCFVLALGLLPATLGAQSSARDHNESANYSEEFAELLHSEAAARSALVTSPSVNSFQAFVHYRKVMKGRAENFIADYEAMAASTYNYVRGVVLPTVGQCQSRNNLICQKVVVASSHMQ